MIPALPPFPPFQCLSRRLTAGMLLLVCLGLTACENAKEKAIVELQRRGLAATPEVLMQAVREQNGTVIGFLGQAGVKAAVPAAGEAGILHVAAARKDWALVERLLEFSEAALINHPGPEQRVILELAVLEDQFPLARTLLEAGALPERAAAGPDVLVRHAAGDPELMDRLLAAVPEGHVALASALMRAVAAGETERVQRLLDRKVPAGTVSPEGNGTALELACQGGFQPVVSALIKAGARPAEVPAALAHAVTRKDKELAALLMEAGASPNAAADPAQPAVTPLTESLASGQVALTEIMLRHGADAGFCLTHALSHGDAALMDLLLQQGAPVDRAGPDGNPPLVLAAIAGQVPVIQKLLEKRAPLDQTGALGQSAYHMAVIHRKTEAMELLLAAGAPPDAPFIKPAPPELLPLFGSDYFVKWYQRDENLTPLMLAAARGDTAMVRLLLKAGAKRGAQTKSWHRYPIVFACDTVNIPAAQLLLGREPDGETDKRHAVVSLSRQRVTLFKNDRPVRSARVSTGKRSTPTPTGKYVITDKQTDWVSSIYNVPMPFFMRLSCKEIGLHAGVVPGYPASHGCIRMPRGDVIAFFKILKIGDPVTIEH